LGGFWDWGTEAVIWLQSNAAGWKPLMQALSFLGTTEFLLLLGLTVYWCIDARAGVRLGLLLVSGAALGGILKLAFHMPRPYWVDARVQPLAAEATYGMPSIHSLYAWSITPWLGWLARRGAGLAAGLLLAFGISISRIHLGVHFPADVIAGFVAGLMVWVGVDLAIRFLGPILTRAGFPLQCLAAAAASILLLLAQAVVLGAIDAAPDPALWTENAARVDVIFPRNPDHIISLAGLILGMGIGLACKGRWAPFRAAGGAEKQILRFLLGLSVTLMLWGGVSILWNEPARSAAPILRYLRYGLVGFWTVFLAPLLFLRWRLADRAE
jgi:membrane-associated phospholipid phosphatase